LSVDYGSLSFDYGSLCFDYGGLTVDYGGLTVDYGGLTVDYGGLRVDYGGLSVDYGGLRVDYGGLSVDYGGLSVDYGSLSVDYGGKHEGGWGGCSRLSEGVRGCQNFCVSSDSLMAVSGRLACGRQALLGFSGSPSGGGDAWKQLRSCCRFSDRSTGWESILQRDSNCCGGRTGRMPRPVDWGMPSVICRS